MSDNFIRDLMEDDHGYLCVAVDPGVNKLDPTTDRTTRYLHDPNNRNSLGGDFANEAETARCSLWQRRHQRVLPRRHPGQSACAARGHHQGIEGHYGLRGMPERAALIGGQLAVWSEVGTGEVELRLLANAVYAASRTGSWRSRRSASKTPARGRGDVP